MIGTEQIAGLVESECERHANAGDAPRCTYRATPQTTDPLAENSLSVLGWQNRGPYVQVLELELGFQMTASLDEISSLSIGFALGSACHCHRGEKHESRSTT